MPIDEVFKLTPRQAFNLINYHYKDRGEVLKIVIKIIGSVFGAKQDDDDEQRIDTKKTIQPTPKLDKISKDQLTRLRNLRDG
jgi:hypothetical protein